MDKNEVANPPYFLKTLNETGAPGWNVAHTSDGFGCRTSFCYSSEDLCTHHESDHNIYGVCKVSQPKILAD